MTRKPQKTKPTQDITLTIHNIGAGGDGISNHDGKLVYVPKTAAGDHITARIEETSEGFKGQVLSVIDASPERITPPCPYFNQCGGCNLQHIKESAYRAWKIAKVKTTLERNDILPKIWEEPVFLPPTTRRRTTLALLKTKDDLLLGYHEQRSHTIVSVERCLILDPVLDQKIQAMRPYLLKLAPPRKTLDITLQLAGGLDVVLTGEWGNFTLAQNEFLARMMEDLDIARISLRPKEFATPEILLTRKNVIKKFGALNISLPPGAFLQASNAGEKTLTEIVTRYAQPATTIADLFCGCGTFTGSLLEAGKKVHAVDGDAEAMKALTAANHSGLTTARRNLFKEPLTTKELEKFDCVVFDPPRAGAKEQVSLLSKSKIPRIIGISCNPATFARDAKILKEEGYTLQSVTLVNQFVYSTHVEIVGLFLKL